MAEPEIISAGGALQTLVHQFSDPLSFYRELIQNAIDAGSRVVEVELSHAPKQAQMVICVEDSGAGMTAQIIDSQLTCLFSSEKDDDLTRIGKFGIGFVSVFAMAPQRVTVETARDGEGWRIDFFQDGTFERTPLVEVREGTKIQLFKPATLAQFEELKARSREVLSYWCKHVNGEILFCGERLDQPFGVEVECPLTWTGPGSEISLGYAPDFRPFIGFYNRGLTLLESRTEHTFPGVMVKVNSDFLEHTLTRDKVVEDEGFAKLLTRVAELVEKELPEMLFAELEERDSQRETVCHALAGHYGWRPLRVLSNTDLSHPHGEARGEDWVAIPGEHPAGLICAGPGLAELGQEQTCEAVFRLRIPSDNYTDPETEVAVITVALGKKSSLTQDLRHKHFDQEMEWNEFVINFSYDPAHRLDFRVDWKGQVPLTLKEVEIRQPALRRGQWGQLELAAEAFRTPGGLKVSLRDVLLAQKEQRLLVAAATTPLVEALEEKEYLILKALPGDPEWALLVALLGQQPKRVELQYVYPLEVESEAPPALRLALQGLAPAWGGKLRDVRLARSCCSQDWPAILVTEFGQLERLSEVKLSRRGKGEVLVLNCEHASVQRVLSLAEKQTELAAYLLVKHFLLQSGLNPDLDAELALRAWQGMSRG